MNRKYHIFIVTLLLFLGQFASFGQVLSGPSSPTPNSVPIFTDSKRLTDSSVLITNGSIYATNFNGNGLNLTNLVNGRTLIVDSATDASPTTNVYGQITYYRNTNSISLGTLTNTVNGIITGYGNLASWTNITGFQIFGTNTPSNITTNGTVVTLWHQTNSAAGGGSSSDPLSWSASIPDYSMSSAGFIYRTSLRNGGGLSTGAFGALDPVGSRGITITNMLVSAVNSTGYIVGTGTNFTFLVATNAPNVYYGGISVGGVLGTFYGNGVTTVTNFSGLNIKIPANQMYQLQLSNNISTPNMVFSWSIGYTNN